MAAAGVGDVDEWRISLDLNPAELPALTPALPRVIPAERHALIMGGWESGPDEAYLSITVDASTQSEAFEKAANLYRRARAEAGLGDERPTVVGFVSPIFGEPLYERLKKEAAHLLTQGRYALAVVRAQTAAEVYARRAFEDLLRRRGGDALVSALLQQSTPTLRAAPARGLLYVLTGERIDEEPWWPGYLQHLKRRNGIVHEGWAIAEQDASDSLEVTGQLTDFVRAAWDSTL